jgi:hypothetical protein
VRDHGEIGTRGLIWFGATLFPVAQSADGYAIARGEFLLCQSERATQCPCSGDRLQPGKGGIGERLRVRVFERRRMNFRIGQRIEAPSVMLPGFHRDNSVAHRARFFPGRDDQNTLPLRLMQKA